jgi:hypothetical protein
MNFKLFHWIRALFSAFKKSSAKKELKLSLSSHSKGETSSREINFLYTTEEEPSEQSLLKTPEPLLKAPEGLNSLKLPSFSLPEEVRPVVQELFPQKEKEEKQSSAEISKALLQDLVSEEEHSKSSAEISKALLQDLLQKKEPRPLPLLEKLSPVGEEDPEAFVATEEEVDPEPFPEPFVATEEEVDPEPFPEPFVATEEEVDPEPFPEPFVATEEEVEDPESATEEEVDPEDTTEEEVDPEPFVNTSEEFDSDYPHLPTVDMTNPPLCFFPEEEEKARPRLISLTEKPTLLFPQEETFTIGRRRDCGIVLDKGVFLDPVTKIIVHKNSVENQDQTGQTEISNIHAEIQVQGSEISIKDLGSTNGTFVYCCEGGKKFWKKLEPHVSTPLTHSTRISFGHRDLFLYHKNRSKTIFMEGEFKHHVYVLSYKLPEIKLIKREIVFLRYGDGQYSKPEPVGSGRFGRVVWTRDETNKKKYAIKLLKGNSLTHFDWDRTQESMEILKGLDHPHIVKIYRLEAIGEFPAFWMDFLEGRPLEDFISEGIALDYVHVKKIAKQLASALEYAIKKKVIHHDIKPGNIMIDSEYNATLYDFECVQIASTTCFISKVINEGSGRVRTYQKEVNYPETLQYKAPEKFDGQTFLGSSDMYSLGITLYEALTGKIHKHAQYSSYDLVDSWDEHSPLAEQRPCEVLSKNLPCTPTQHDLLCDLIACCLNRLPQDRPEPQAFQAL